MFCGYKTYTTVTRNAMIFLGPELWYNIKVTVCDAGISLGAGLCPSCHNDDLASKDLGKEAEDGPST